MIKVSEPYFNEEEINAVTAVLRSGQIAQGPKVQEFEEKFAKLCNVKYAVAVNNGTSALHAALSSVGIQEGDEVITTPFTFIATANAILMCGAKPVFADVHEDTFNIDPEKVKEKITDKTKAILVVDLYGQPADYKNLRKISNEHNLVLIEDACQSINAELEGIKAGALGDLAVFSFYATKNITTGEGGIITTNNKQYSDMMKSFRFHSRISNEYEHSGVGYNYRMTDIAAALGIVQLSKLDEITNKRILNAKYFTEQLKDVVSVPVAKPNCKHVFHQYTIKVDEKIRDKLVALLAANDIGCGIFYPKPVHLQSHFLARGYKSGDFPVAEKLSKTVISLPVQPKLTKQELDKIVSVIHSI
jgi:perosamine synthetase